MSLKLYTKSYDGKCDYCDYEARDRNDKYYHKNNKCIYNPSSRAYINPGEIKVSQKKQDIINNSLVEMNNINRMLNDEMKAVNNMKKQVNIVRPEPVHHSNEGYKHYIEQSDIIYDKNKEIKNLYSYLSNMKNSSNTLMTKLHKSLTDGNVSHKRLEEMNDMVKSYKKTVKDLNKIIETKDIEINRLMKKVISLEGDLTRKNKMIEDQNKIIDGNNKELMELESVREDAAINFEMYEGMKGSYCDLLEKTKENKENWEHSTVATSILKEQLEDLERQLKEELDLNKRLEDYTNDLKEDNKELMEDNKEKGVMLRRMMLDGEVHKQRNPPKEKPKKKKAPRRTGKRIIYKKLSVKELKTMCKMKGHKGYSKLNKTSLIKLAKKKSKR